ncbi:MAG TPA: serine hydrolase domain-containing protein [Terracidiphilus sp.]|jgi:CubicO group peptidase (beta-lactamase class C family)
MRIASTLCCFAASGVLLLSSSAIAQHAKAASDHTLDLTVVKPESVGFSSERLERLHTLIQDEIDKKQLGGAVTILARHGKVVEYRTYGKRDLATGADMTRDTIFRDYSMTKPVTGVAMMILYEEGKWQPSDPIAKYIPEFAPLKVFGEMDADGKMILVDPDHAPTMRELMTHTAGFTYGFISNTPVDKMYRDEKVLGSANLQEMIEKLAKIPLMYQPGKGWAYSISMDIQGYIVEKLSGQSLPDFMREHIYEPLGMRDAGFYVPEDKRSRFATLYNANAQGELVAGEPGDFAKQPTMASGGGGMVSTAEDYFRFASMLANGGELDGKRVLAPSTVKLMTSNHTPDSLLTGEFGIGMSVIRPGFAWGYDCAVIFDPAEANLSDGKGTFFWDGAAGTWFFVDPANDIVFVAMIQRRGGSDNHALEYRAHAVVDQALVDPSK